ncbi:MAG TPA: hypothetical protein VEJ46_13960 [Candidatus Acidoferrum sp.]|nr:hypothetical protein [Candidatus Acidoferrum sp.]
MPKDELGRIFKIMRGMPMTIGARRVNSLGDPARIVDRGLSFELIVRQALKLLAKDTKMAQRVAFRHDRHMTKAHAKMPGHYGVTRLVNGVSPDSSDAFGFAFHALLVIET